MSKMTDWEEMETVFTDTIQTLQSISDKLTRFIDRQKKIMEDKEQNKE